MKILPHLLMLIATLSNAQVGIGTTTPAGALDLNPTVPTNYGLIAPRVSLTSTILQAPVINPQGGAIPAGTVVYNMATAGVPPDNVGPGLYYWNGLKWIAFAGSPGGLDWSLTGNSSTVPGSYVVPGPNYIGSSDNTPIHFSVNGLPRMRITTSGNVGIGQSSTVSTRLTVDSALATDGTIAATSIGSDVAFVIPTASFKNNATTNYSTAIIANTPNAAGAASPNIAIRAASGNASYISPMAAQNIAITANSTDTAIYAITEGTTATTRRAGEFRTNDTGISTDADANDPSAYLAGYANGVDINNGGNIRNVKYGGYFYGGNANAFAYVGVRLSSNFGGSSNYKILGAGTVSTIVSSNKDNDPKKIMFAPEAPEVLFEDYGTGQLSNGTVKIDIDPVFSKNIFIDDMHPLKVFIQLEGDCNGVFVTNKTKNSFIVKELNGGKSNVKFSWHIVGNRADEIEANGEKTSYQYLRYPDAPGSLTPSPIESKQLKPSKIEEQK